MPGEHVLITLKKYLAFFINQSIVSWTAHPPLKITQMVCSNYHGFGWQHFGFLYNIYMNRSDIDNITEAGVSQLSQLGRIVDLGFQLWSRWS